MKLLMIIAVLMPTLAFASNDKEEHNFSLSIIKCVDGVVWFDFEEQGLPINGVIWSDEKDNRNEFVECSKNDYTLSGKKISEKDVLDLAIKNFID